MSTLLWYSSCLTAKPDLFTSQPLLKLQILPPDPRFPFVEGSYQNLNDAFDWAEKYGIAIWLDYHAHNGSQNGYAVYRLFWSRASEDIACRGLR